jgi:hypothetical protein
VGIPEQRQALTTVHVFSGTIQLNHGWIHTDETKSNDDFNDHTLRRRSVNAVAGAKAFSTIRVHLSIRG